MHEIDKENGDRVNVSISRRAYDALVTYTRQVNEKDNDIQKKPFTIEEVLDEEIICFSVMNGKKSSSMTAE
jgi:hypothetical protein